MSAKVDQFCDRVRDRLDAIAGRLMAVKTNMKALPEQAEKAQARLRVWKQCVQQPGANLKAKALDARAGRAETYAADVLECAVASIDEAEKAILAAVGAGIDADVAQKAAGSAPPGGRGMKTHEGAVCRRAM
jgi:hypothetical protein